MGIEIKEVLNKKELWTWVRFPNRLYKDNDFFVPFLENDEFETFSKNKNPAYAFCETRLFLAYRDGKLVGRIAGLINHAYNKKWDKNAIRFTRFDSINDRIAPEHAHKETAGQTFPHLHGLTSRFPPNISKKVSKSSKQENRRFEPCFLKVSFICF